MRFSKSFDITAAEHWKIAGKQQHGVYGLACQRGCCRHGGLAVPHLPGFAEGTGPELACAAEYRAIR